MSTNTLTPEARDREAYYRAAYQTTMPPRIPPEVMARAEAYRDGVLRPLLLGGRASLFRPESERAQLSYVRDRYGMIPPHGIGVRQGEYATLRTDQIDNQTKFIATDFLMDCHALILVARDAQGNVLQTLLGHLDSMTDVPQAVPALLAQMPAGSRIDATVIGSSINTNPYLQADLIRTLAQAPNVNRVRYNFDAASTVAVETSTGRILTAAAPAESLATSYDIRELPVAIEFSPLQRGYSVRNLGYDYFQTQTPRSTLGLHNVYQPGVGFVPDPISKMVLEMQADRNVEYAELQAVARQLGQLVHRELQLDYRQIESENPADPTFKVTVSTVEGARIGEFIAFCLNPSLGSAGSVRER